MVKSAGKPSERPITNAQNRKSRDGGNRSADSLRERVLVPERTLPCEWDLPLDAEDEGLWALGEMAGCSLPDPRFVVSAARNAHRLVLHCGESFSAACGHDGRQAATRLFHHRELTVGRILQGHYKQTARRCAEHEVVIVADDSSAYDYSGHTALEGLGPLGDNSATRGLWGHAAMAMTPKGQPLGLLDLNLWARNVAEMGRAKERRKRPLEEKESFKWLQAQQAIERNLHEHPCLYIVTDRESDVFGYIAAPRRPTTHLVIRACWKRNVEMVDVETLDVVGGTGAKKGREGHLFEVMEEAPEVARTRVTVGRRPGQKEREAEISIRAMEVYLLPPRHPSPGESKNKQKVTLLRAVELSLLGAEGHGVEPSREKTSKASEENKVEPVDWTLIVTEGLGEDPEKRAAKACDLIYYYSLRWGIERLHYTLKSGCGVEKLQIGKLPALMNALAFFHIVAWRLLSLMHLARCAPETPAEAELTREELAVLRAMERKPLKTIAEAVRAIARLGGYEVYRSAPPPGVKRLWLGLRALRQMVSGWRLAQTALG